jgi:hypothetical protein
MFPDGMPGFDGAAMRFNVRIHNANPVPIFDVELLASEPTNPPDSPKIVQGEWHAIGPGTTEATVEIGLWLVEPHTHEGDPELEIQFTDIDGQRWSRGERGQPAPLDR